MDSRGVPSSVAEVVLRFLPSGGIEVLSTFLAVGLFVGSLELSELPALPSRVSSTLLRMSRFYLSYPFGDGGDSLDTRVKGGCPADSCDTGTASGPVAMCGHYRESVVLVFALSMGVSS